MKRSLAALLALAASGCGLLYAEGEVQEVCITLPTQQIPIGIGPPGTYPFRQEMPFDLNGAIPGFILNGDTANREVRMLQIEVSVPSGQPLGANLDWVADARLEVQPALGSRLAAATLFDYTRGTASLPVTRVALAPVSGVNLADYLAASQMSLVLSGNATFTGAAPASESVTVKGCFYARVKATLQDALNGG